MDIIDADTKEQPQLPKQVKLVATPRIKLKYNDISDEEFRIIMKHQVESVSFYLFVISLFFMLNN
jgi:hypothetical protein